MMEKKKKPFPFQTHHKTRETTPPRGGCEMAKKGGPPSPSTRHQGIGNDPCQHLRPGFQTTIKRTRGGRRVVLFFFYCAPNEKKDFQTERGGANGLLFNGRVRERIDTPTGVYIDRLYRSTFPFDPSSPFFPEIYSNYFLFFFPCGGAV